MSLPKGRVAVLAFGTHGDVLPVAVVAAELAKDKPNCAITFITHSAHKISKCTDPQTGQGPEISISERKKQFLKRPLASAGVSFHPISTAPVELPPDPLQLQPSEIGSPKSASKETWRTDIEQQHREECLLAVEQVFGQQLEDGPNFILFNFFALEGWHLAELYRVPCAVAAPYVVPYSAPASFERKFHAAQPQLYERLQHSKPGEVGWGEVMHWMWPLFTDRWTHWRAQCLHLSACPLTDPVTELPVMQDWPRAPPLLYGFSQAVVECPEYWPRSIHVCGFWYAPPEWDTMYDQPESVGISHPANNYGTNPLESRSAPLHSKLLSFISQSTEVEDRPIFFGLSSTGSMGYLKNPENFLKVIVGALETLNRRAVLFTSSYLPLDSVIAAAWRKTDLLTRTMETRAQYSTREDLKLLKDGIRLSNDRLFCFSGFVAYNWLFPKCSIVVHHGGSGTTASALRCGVPQIICPFVLDQFYWAERMAWIGVSPQPLSPNHLCPLHGDVDFLQAVSAVVKAVSGASNAGMQGRAYAWSQKICQEDGLRKFVQFLSEELSC